MSAVRVTVRAKPRARVSRVLAVSRTAAGLHVDVAIAAVPADGAANLELTRVLAAALDAPKRDVELVLGGASKNKVVEVRGLDEATVEARLTASVRGT